MKIDKYYHLYGRKLDVVFEEIPNPVRRGRWNDMRESAKDVPHIECSACGKPVYTAIRYAYCPNCGAKMDVEKI